MMDQARLSGKVLTDSQVIAGEKGYEAHKKFSQAIDGVANKIGNALMPAATDFLNYMTTTGIPAIEKFVGQVSTGFNRVVAIVRPIITAVVAFLVEKFGQLHRFISSVMPQIQDVVRRVLGAITAFWKAHGAQIMDFVGHLWDSVKAIFGTALDIIHRVIVFVLDIIQGKWKDAWNQVKGIVGDVLGLIGRLLKNAGPMLLDALKLGFALMLTIGKWLLERITGLVGAILGDIGDAAGKIGGAIVGGIVAGLVGAWHWITEKLTALAKLLPEPLQKVLGIKSPSLVFAREIGLPIAQGIGEGVMQGLPAIRQSLAYVTAPSYTSTSTTNNNQRSIVNHFTINGAQDPKAVAEAVRAELVHQFSY